MSTTITEIDTKAALEILNRTLLRVFGAGGGAPTGLVEISGVVGKALTEGTYPLVNMWVGMNILRNPDMALLLGIAVTSVVEALQKAQGDTAVKQ